MLSDESFVPEPPALEYAPTLPPGAEADLFDDEDIPPPPDLDDTGRPGNATRVAFPLYRTSLPGPRACNTAASSAKTQCG